MSHVHHSFLDRVFASLYLSEPVYKEYLYRIKCPSLWLRRAVVYKTKACIIQDRVMNGRDVTGILQEWSKE